MVSKVFNSVGDDNNVVSSTGVTKQQQLLQCDYLVVGAGTAGMSFVDTIITENPDATVVLLDRNSQAGGHWTQAYPFVKLHQPSCLYGVNSLPLGKTFLSKNGNIKERYDIHDRVSGAEILDYYQTACDQFVATGRVKCIFDCEYKIFDEQTGLHTAAIVNNNSPTSSGATTTNDDDDNNNDNNDDNVVFTVKCRKLVTVKTNVTVPSMRKPLIPVAENVHFVPVNEVPACAKSGKYKKYIVFGNGKTGTDAIINLLDGHQIDESQITWVISRDVWYFLRDASEDFYHSFDIFKKMAEANSVKECYLTFEKEGLVGRLDTGTKNNVVPDVFKGPTIDNTELQTIRTISNIVRMGRATSIESNKVVCDKGSFDFSPEDTLLVDCMVDNLYGYDFKDDFKIFEPNRINLGPLTLVFNVSMSSAHIAFLECALDRKKNKNKNKNKTNNNGNTNNDDAKNKCCFFLRGPVYTLPNPEFFIGMMYMQNKSVDALMKVKGGSKFFFNSRANMMAPKHHKGGMTKLLWNTFGPKQMCQFDKKLAKKIESKGYSDIDHCFGIETFV